MISASIDIAGVNSKIETDLIEVDVVVGSISIPASNDILLKKHRNSGSLFIVLDDYSNLFYPENHTEKTLQKLYKLQRFGLSPSQIVLLLDGSKHEIRPEQRDLSLQWNMNGGTTLFTVGCDLLMNLRSIEKALTNLEFKPNLATSIIAMLPSVDTPKAAQYQEELGFGVFLQALVNPTVALKNYWGISADDVQLMRKVLGITDEYETINFSLFKKSEDK